MAGAVINSLASNRDSQFPNDPDSGRKALSGFERFRQSSSLGANSTPRGLSFVERGNFQNAQTASSRLATGQAAARFADPNTNRPQTSGTAAKASVSNETPRVSGSRGVAANVLLGETKNKANTVKRILLGA